MGAEIVNSSKGMIFFKLTCTLATNLPIALRTATPEAPHSVDTLVWTVMLHKCTLIQVYN